MKTNINLYLTNQVAITSHKLKLKLIANNILENKCNCCALTHWLGKPIALHLHHVDGNNKNNVLTNLSILCPNCHAQTKNYCGKNKQKKPKHIVTDEEIITAIKESYTKRQALLKVGLIGYGANYKRINKILTSSNVKFLSKPLSETKQKQIDTIIEKYGSYSNLFKTKINWPDKETLEKLLKSKPCSQIAKELKVSHAAVTNKAKKYGINVKEINPWSKRHGR